MTFNYQYGSLNDTPLFISFHPSQLTENKHTLIYFHGGGLIFGNRDDLSKIYIDKLTLAGHNLITVDYPLAPECKVDTIFNSLELFFDWFDKHYSDTLGLASNNKILFGRSAGAYLALQLANKHKVNGVISFYGYHTLFHNDFLLPSQYFLKYPTIVYSDINHLLSKKILLASSVEERYPIYLSLRQSGNWIKEILGNNNSIDDYSLKATDLKKLPPIFITASKSDEDVPFFLSNMLAKQVPSSTFITHTNLVHDFDRDTSLQESKETYHALISWLDNLN